MASEQMTFDKVLEGASRLEPGEQQRLIEALLALARRHDEFEGSHSPMELRGLGKEVWRDKETGKLVDAQEYVNQERDSWDG